MSVFKRVAVAVIFMAVLFSVNGQSGNVGMTLELKPILKVDMIAPDQIDFVFNSKEEFVKGITKKSATVLKITSTVNWDMYAIGRTTYETSYGKTSWNQEQSFDRTTNSVANLPLSLLELRQNRINNGSYGSNGLYNDYSQEFSNNVNGGNSIYVPSDGSLSPPARNGKYIAGHSGIAQDNVRDYIPAGSYESNSPNANDFYYEMDYRILPGYPAIFPNASSSDATAYQDIVSYSRANSVIAGRTDENFENYYAEPGLYTMRVQYIILEDQ
jgi:hypothetical protein